MIERTDNGLKLQGGRSSLSKTLVFGAAAGLIFCLFFLGPFFFRAWLVLTFIIIPMVLLLSRLGRNEVLFDDSKGVIDRGNFPLPYDKVKTIIIAVSGESFSIAANKRFGLVQTLPVKEMREVRQEMESRFPDVRVIEVKGWVPFVKIAAMLVLFYMAYAFSMDAGSPPLIKGEGFPEGTDGFAVEHVIGGFILSLPGGYNSVEGSRILPIADTQSDCKIINGPDFFFPRDDFINRAKRKNISFVMGTENYYDLLNMAAHSRFGFVPIFLRTFILDWKETVYEFENHDLQGLLVISTLREKKVEVLAVEGKDGDIDITLRSVCKDKEPTLFRDMNWSIRPR